MSLPPLDDLERAKLTAKGHGCYIATALGNGVPLYTLWKNGKVRGRETDPAALLALVLRVTSKRVRRRGKENLSPVAPAVGR